MVLVVTFGCLHYDGLELFLALRGGLESRVRVPLAAPFLPRHAPGAHAKPRRGLNPSSAARAGSSPTVAGDNSGTITEGQRDAHPFERGVYVRFDERAGRLVGAAHGGNHQGSDFESSGMAQGTPRKEWRMRIAGEGPTQWTAFKTGFLRSRN